MPEITIALLLILILLGCLILGTLTAIQGVLVAWTTMQRPRERDDADFWKQEPGDDE